MIKPSNTNQRLILSLQIRFSMVIPFRHTLQAPLAPAVAEVE